MKNYFRNKLCTYIVSATSFFAVAPITVNNTATLHPNSSVSTSNVGTLKATFEVTGTGSASYTIPLSAPPGTADMAPMLSLVYNSQQQNGMVGMGFALDGLTAITRCGSNKAQNGVIHGVDYTDQDRFCLNGEQLVAIKGTYGADGAEYRTYIDSKAKIISYGRQGNGPAKFLIYTKGGQVAEYAYTSDSQILAQGKTSVAVWALDKIVDTAGNYILFKYTKDDTNGIYYPSEIDYTGNEAAKLAPYNSVKFSYQDRPDQTEHYSAGSVTRLTKRLNGIQTYSGTDLVANYKLVYEQSPNTGRSRLASAQLCDADNICLPETKFTWQTNQEGWQWAPQFTPPIPIIFNNDPQDNGVRFADLNADGLPDIAQRSYRSGNSTSSAYLNTGNGWQSTPSFIPPDNITLSTSPQDNGVRFIDLNGDGFTDLIQRSFRDAHPDQDYSMAALNTGSGWQSTSAYLSPVDIALYASPQDNGVRLMDLNGDGLMDLVQKSYRNGDNPSGAYLNNGTSWQSTPSFIPPDNITLSSNPQDNGVRFIDLNGDGLPDITQKSYRDGSNIQSAYLNTGTGWQSTPSFIPPDNITLSTSPQDNGVRFVDLNGDGLPDFVQKSYREGGSPQSAYINTGVGWKYASYFVPPENITLSSNPQDNGFRFVDLNGDGLPDVIQRSFRDAHPDTDYSIAYINTGSGWKSAPAYLSPVDITMYKKPQDNGVVFIDLNGDGLVDVAQRSIRDEGDINGAWLNKAQKLPDYLISATDGLGDTLEITYAALTDKKYPNLYSKEHDAKFPITDVQTSMYVVAQTIGEHASNDPATVNASEGQHVTFYTYKGAKVDNRGYGFLGFHQVTTTDGTTGISKTTTYSQDVDNHTDGEIAATETKLSNGAVISTTQSIWNTKVFGDGQPNTTYYQPYTKQAITKSYDLAGNLLSTKTTDFIVDDYNNPTQITDTIQDSNGSYTTTTNNLFDNNLAHWFIGALTQTSVTAAATNKTSITRTSTFSYDPNTGMLKQTIIEPNDPVYRLTTTYARDGFGNITKTTVSGTDIEDRVTTSIYDPTGRFVVTTTNPLNQTTSQLYDPRFGAVTKATDPNNVSIVNQYDGFGRLVETDRPDGTSTIMTLNWTPNNIYGAVYSETISKTDSPDQIKYFDKLNRIIAETTQGLNGETIVNFTMYDDLGRISKKTPPFFFGQQTPQYTIFEYDPLGRVVKTIRPNQATATNAYNGFSTTTINPLNQQNTKVLNAREDVIKTIDNQNHQTLYEYDVFSNLVKVTDSQGNITSMSYDKYGRKTAMDDPDRGHWTYSYDVLGQLTSQTDSLKQTTSFKYDKLGRMISRTDPAGTSTWQYDTAAHGIGKLASVNGVAGAQGQKADAADLIKAIQDNLVNYKKIYSYDTLSRPIQTDTIINNITYTSKVSYDQDSRPDVITYPSGLQIKNNYNSLGYLTLITNQQTKQFYWLLNSMDAQGHVTSETHSNGLITNYIYDPQTSLLSGIDTLLDQSLLIQKRLFPMATALKATQVRFDKPITAPPRAGTRYLQLSTYEYDDLGNLKARNDNVNKEAEIFGYDSLNRLTQSQNSSSTITYKYDELGNLTYKSDIGTYIYTKGKQPHAVNSTSGTFNNTYQYNTNGDQISATINSIKRTISYTSYSKPKNISMGGATTDFYYNADRESFERIDKVSGKTTTTLYLGGYELVTIDDGKTITTQQKHYIGPNTIYVKSSDGKDNVYETLKDNLGSITDITDANANVVQHFTYTPFGYQKQTKGSTPTTPITHQGFTGHEEVEIMNLIHMVGRIYDPVLGRFLSADPTVQMPEDGQNLNRYSYCLNNPLLFTDPDGYGLFSGIGDLFSSICDAIGSALSAVCELAGDLLGNQTIMRIMQMAIAIYAPYAAMFIIPAMSAAMAAIGGGNFGDIMMAAAMTVITMQTWNVVGIELGANGAEWYTRSLVHGVVGGSLNELQGGNFKDGFLACAVGEAMGGAMNKIPSTGCGQADIMIRSTAAGVIGGTTAAVTGGNFWNGAKDAAFARLFNNELDALSMAMSSSNPQAQQAAMQNVQEVLAHPIAHAIIPFSALLVEMPLIGEALFGAEAEVASISDILMPGGKTIGEEGSKIIYRELSGGAEAAEEMFGRLTQGAERIYPPGYDDGIGYRLPDGGFAGYRPISNSGPPTIDINIPDIPIKKIKFLE